VCDRSAKKKVARVEAHISHTSPHRFRHKRNKPGGRRSGNH
jgi:hypothetical protein